jgi:hypothetical protein
MLAYVRRHDLPPVSSFVPHSRNYGGQAGQVALCIDIQGLKPLAESCHPFGISPIVAAGQNHPMSRQRPLIFVTFVILLCKFVFFL